MKFTCIKEFVDFTRLISVGYHHDGNPYLKVWMDELEEDSEDDTRSATADVLYYVFQTTHYDLSEYLNQRCSLADVIKLCPVSTYRLVVEHASDGGSMSAAFDWTDFPKSVLPAPTSRFDPDYCPDEGYAILSRYVHLGD